MRIMSPDFPDFPKTLLSYRIFQKHCYLQVGPMSDEILKLLLERNFIFVEQIASTTMTWWVSSIVFCATILGLSWWHRDRLALLPFLHIVCGVIFLFLLSFPAYAFLIWHGVDMFESEIKLLLASAKAINHLPPSFQVIKIAVLMGALCFCGCLVLWILVWHDLAALKKAKKLKSPIE